MHTFQRRSNGAQPRGTMRVEGHRRPIRCQTTHRVRREGTEWDLPSAETPSPGNMEGAAATTEVCVRFTVWPWLATMLFLVDRGSETAPDLCGTPKDTPVTSWAQDCAGEKVRDGVKGLESNRRVICGNAPPYLNEGSRAIPEPGARWFKSDSADLVIALAVAIVLAGDALTVTPRLGALGGLSTAHAALGSALALQHR